MGRANVKNPQFSASKTVVSKVGGATVKNCGFQPKTAVSSVVFNCGGSQGRKPQFLAENCSFQCGFQLWEEPRQKLQFLAKNHGFGQKLWFHCGFQLWEELRPKTMVFQPKTTNLGLNTYENTFSFTFESAPNRYTSFFFLIILV